MRISTVQINRQGLTNILEQQQKLLQTQMQIATGKRILKPSDDPVGASQALLLNQQLRISERHQGNINLAETRLQIEEGVLNSVSNVIQRIRELHIQASSTLTSGTAREGIVEELKGRLDELAALANTQDADGSHIFAGFQIQGQAYSKNSQGVYIYNGDQGQNYVSVAGELKIAISDPGSDIFSYQQGNGTFVVNDSGATNTGTAVIGETSVTNFAAYVPDTYTINL